MFEVGTETAKCLILYFTTASLFCFCNLFEDILYVIYKFLTVLFGLQNS